LLQHVSIHIKPSSGSRIQCVAKITYLVPMVRVVIDSWDEFFDGKFYFLLNLHLGVILFIGQLDAQFFFVYVYFSSLHVSSNQMLIIRRFYCINTISGICHSM